MPNLAEGERRDAKRALAELAADPTSRKRFLKMMGGGVGTASALSVFLAACGGGDDKTTTGGAGATNADMGTTTGRERDGR